MNFIQKVFNEFSEPSSFGGSPYSWLTNQLGHGTVSFLFCYFTGWWKLLSLFWIAWELNHYRKSKDLKDFIEDIVFEMSGVLIFLFSDTFLIPSLVLLFVLFLVKVYNK